MRHRTILALTLLSVPPVSGQDQEATREDALERLEKALETEEALAPETKEALQDLVEALRAEPPAGPPSLEKGEVIELIDEYLGLRGPEKPPVWEQILADLALYGDFRFRHESSFDLDDSPDRHRERLRLRLGTNYQLLEEVLIGARIRTGSADDPNSPHSTLGDVFDSIEVSLDRAFVSYRPLWAEGAAVTAGKFAHPFYQNPVYSELVWDADVQPEGAYAGYTISDPDLLLFLDQLTLTAGGYLLLEQGSADDAFGGVFQPVGQRGLFEDVTANLAVDYYLYTDVTPDGSSAILRDNAGNATVDRDGDGTADEFRSRFGVLNPILGLTYTGWDYPVTASAEYMLNTEARISEDQGWAVGVAVGTTERQGDWRAYYQWQVVEQDAIFSAFANDDFLLATNHRSHVFGLYYQVFDKVGVHLWTLVSERDKTFPGATTDSDKAQWQLRLDVNLRF